MSDTETDDQPRYPIEHRNAELAGINFAKRIIDVLAIPWDKETVVMHQGQVMREVVCRGAFDGLEKRPGRVRVNRDHDETRTVGKMLAAHTSGPDGLIAQLRIAQTSLGDETLQLADEGCLAPSVGFAAGGSGHRIIRNPSTPPPPSDQLERIPIEARNRIPLRRVLRAYLGHIALVPEQAYDQAGVLAVRGASLDIPQCPPAQLPPVLTPTLDEWSMYLEARHAKVRS